MLIMLYLFKYAHFELFLTKIDTNNTVADVGIEPRSHVWKSNAQMFSQQLLAVHKAVEIYYS